MPGVFLTDVVEVPSPLDGPGATQFQVSIPAGISYSVLMIDPVHLKAIIAANVTSISYPQVFLAYSAATWAALTVAGETTSPTTPQRNSINNWLTTNGYAAVPSGTWKQVIENAAKQVNPVADVNLSFAS